MVLKGLHKFVKDKSFGDCYYMGWSKCYFQLSQAQKCRRVGAGEMGAVMLLLVQISSLQHLSLSTAMCWVWAPWVFGQTQRGCSYVLILSICVVLCLRIWIFSSPVTLVHPIVQ